MLFKSILLVTKLLYSILYILLDKMLNVKYNSFKGWSQLDRWTPLRKVLCKKLISKLSFSDVFCQKFENKIWHQKFCTTSCWGVTLQLHILQVNVLCKNTSKLYICLLTLNNVPRITRSPGQFWMLELLVLSMQ